MKKVNCFSSFFCLAVSMILLLTGCGIKPSVLKDSPTKIVEPKWEEVSDGIIVMENENVRFELDALTTHFTVVNKKDGVKYLSVPEMAHETDNKFSSVSSEIVVTYFESTSGTSNNIYSGLNSVDYKAFRIERAENVIRVTYTLRHTEQAVLAPVVLTVERFDELLSKMEASAQRKMRMYYRKYSPENPTDKYKEFLEEYEYLKEKPLYIFKTNATELDKSTVSEFVVSAGYNQEVYCDDLEMMKIDSDDVDLPLSYDIPVEYRITDSGFTADICADMISIGNTRYEINKISLLPWFAPQERGENGFALLPDGSGAVVNFNKSDDAVYSARFYGSDPAKDNEVTSRIMQNACMNMVAADFGKSGFLAVVKGCAEQGLYNIRRRGQGNFDDGVFTSFEVFNGDETPIRREKTLLLVSDTVVSANPSVDYILIGNKTPNEIAVIYRDELIKEKMLVKKEVSAPLYLEFVGYTTVKASFLGVPYDKKITLSKLSSVIECIERLNEVGIDNIVVRLKDFGNGGEKHTVQDKFSLYSGVGTKEELKKLSDMLSRGGGRLYLENDCSVVYSDAPFDNFFSFENTARQIDNTIAVKKPINIVNGNPDEDADLGYYVAPINYKTVVSDFSQSMSKAIGSSEVGISLGFAGNMLISDFSSSHISDRCKTALYVCDAIKTVKESSGGVMVDGGNIYAAMLADGILNMPLSSSLLNIEEYSLPIYPMVIHSYVDYSGSAINNCADPVREYLRSVASGASLYYKFVTETDALLEIEAGQKVYPSGFNEYFDDLVSQNEKYSELSKKVCSAIMTEYKIIDDNVVLTVYDNGVSVITNYSDKEYIYKEKTISPCDFIFIEGNGV